MKTRLQLLLAALTASLLLACASNPPPPPSLPTERFTEATELRRAGGAISSAALLNVGIAVFDPGLSGGEQSPVEVFPELRESEARYFAYLLRKAMGDSEQWGAVRVLPQNDATAELRVMGRIVRSDGERLVLAIRAVDAAGRIWIDQNYRGRGSAERYANAIDADPFTPLVYQIANDLVGARDELEDAALARLTELALLRYAGDLAPATFGAYLARDPEGSVRALRLPSRDDPLIQRVERIRESEYLFADTLDAHYGRLFEDMRIDYTLWRSYSLEEVQALRSYRANTRDRRDDGSVRSMMKRYGDFRELKLQEAALRQAASTLQRVIEPTVVSVEGTEVTLDGSLDERYDQWRSLLQRIQQAETGLPQP